MNTIGMCMILDIYECCSNLTVMEMLIRTACDAADIEIMSDSYHIFTGGGFTYCAIIGESHIVASTYPERKFIELDICTCGDKCVEKIKIVVRHILDKIKFGDIKGIEFLRGNNSDISSRKFEYGKYVNE